MWTPPNQECPPPKPDEPPLHRAARVGDHVAIRDLISSGLDPNTVFDLGLDPGAYPRSATPLMVAAGSGDGASVETVRILISLGADLKVVVDNASAITFACEGLGWNYRPGGDADRLRALLAAGAPVPTHPGARAGLVCRVARAGDAERLRILLGAGLGPNPYWNPEEAKKAAARMTAVMLQYAAENPSQGLASMPDELKASLEERMRKDREENETRQASAPYSHDIPLFGAVASDSLECVRLLLESGADPFIRDNSGETALWSAVSPEMARFLVVRGLRLEDRNWLEWDPLTSALSDGEDAPRKAAALIAAGADLKATHDRGYTVFMSAVGSGRRPDVLRLLVSSGADPLAVSELGYNAFHAAIDVNGEANGEESVRETFTYLKELGVPLEHRNKRGQTPLARAIQEGTATEVKALCEIGADTSALCALRRCGAEGCSDTELPLLFHAADSLHRDQKVEALLKHGADPEVRDAEGHTPLEHLVSELCRGATDHESAWGTFYEGLHDLKLIRQPAPGESFVEVVRATAEQYIRSAVPGPTGEPADYQAEWHEERIHAAASLIAYRWDKRRRKPGT